MVFVCMTFQPSVLGRQYICPSSQYFRRNLREVFVGVEARLCPSFGIIDYLSDLVRFCRVFLVQQVGIYPRHSKLPPPSMLENRQSIGAPRRQLGCGCLFCSSSSGADRLFLTNQPPEIFF